MTSGDPTPYSGRGMPAASTGFGTGLDLSGGVEFAGGRSVFAVSSAVQSGLIEHGLRDPGLLAVSPGIRAWAGAELDWWDRVRAVAALPGDHYFSHVTAARLWGIWLPLPLERSPEIHVTGRRGSAGARRRAEVLHVVGHRAQLAAEEVAEVEGLRLTTPERTWLDLTSVIVRPEYLVAAGDALLQRSDGPGRPPGVFGTNPLSSAPALDEAIGRRRRVKGITAARAARALVRPGVDSARETLMRLVIVEAGLPEPIVNQVVRLSDWLSRRPDLHYRELRIAMQYEGMVHAEMGQVSHDIQRDDEYVTHGWVNVRVGDDLFTELGQRRFIMRLRRAIEEQQRRYGVAWPVA